MPRPIRVIDTGVRGGRENVAFDQALVEAFFARNEVLAASIRLIRAVGVRSSSASIGISS